MEGEKGRGKENRELKENVCKMDRGTFHRYKENEEENLNYG